MKGLFLYQLSLWGKHPFLSGMGLRSGISDFQESFYDGLWVLFFLMALGAAVWIYYDSQKRRLLAVPWRVAGFIAVALLIPAILVKFTVRPSQVALYDAIMTQIEQLELEAQPGYMIEVRNLEAQLEELPALTGFMEGGMLLGILGGIGGLAIAVAYYSNYKGKRGDEQGYTVLDNGGQYGAYGGQAIMGGYPPPPPPVYTPRREAPPPPVKPKAHAWLVTKEGKSFQLYQGETTIGRSSSNDIQIESDTTLSKHHAKIVEQNGHFKLFDLGSTNGTLLNGRRVRQPMLLQADDEIKLGDHTLLRFKC